MDDTFQSMKTEVAVFMERLNNGVPEDPVFEGMVRDYVQFENTLSEVYGGVDKFMDGIDKLCKGLQSLSETLQTGLTKHTEEVIASDTCKFREATNIITRADAPHSAVAKLRRDLDFNVTVPLRSHMNHFRQMKLQLENRKRRLLELQAAKRSLEALKRGGVKPGDKKLQTAEAAVESAKVAFGEIDRTVFEWLHITDDYKGDVYDSLLQTLKYLQYEFFAASAHAVSHVLPARMEFRPMIEMTPEQLEPQVELELQELGEDAAADDAELDATNKILEKWEKDGAFADASAVPVDFMSLSILTSQGFDEGPARKALRLHNNDTQAALDWLLNGAVEEKKPVDSVRMPSTLKRVQKMREHRRREREKREKERRERLANEREMEQQVKRAREQRQERSGRLLDSKESSRRGSVDADSQDASARSSRERAPSKRREDKRDSRRADDDTGRSAASGINVGGSEPPTPANNAMAESLIDFGEAPSATLSGPPMSLDDLLGLAGDPQQPPPPPTAFGGAGAPSNLTRLPVNIMPFDPQNSSGSKGFKGPVPTLAPPPGSKPVVPVRRPSDPFDSMAAPPAAPSAAVTGGFPSFPGPNAAVITTQSGTYASLGVSGGEGADFGGSLMGGDFPSSLMGSPVSFHSSAPPPSQQQLGGFDGFATANSVNLLAASPAASPTSAPPPPPPPQTNQNITDLL